MDLVQHNLQKPETDTRSCTPTEPIVLFTNLVEAASCRDMQLEDVDQTAALHVLWTDVRALRKLLVSETCTPKMCTRQQRCTYCRQLSEAARCRDVQIEEVH